ncbi:hypothetical protein OEW28_02105 [Defluviimonas sp. WL0002]|uniref:Secreted protein n=1 Tax=Albidovulum marisflavi TaxID=2984159 RepID=A0ABT2Z9H4_9RHOB|nr:hypothetical protein [Defluviimonas sp. WL0002]MCV2867421.1 hypothetical protein [Defluviimonas sp. WL0002]
MRGFQLHIRGLRGLASAGAILSVLLSANAVEAAPVTGLPADLGIGVTGIIMGEPNTMLFRAQCGDSDGEGGCEEPGPEKTNPATPVTENTTDQIVDVISTAQETCSDEWINDTYRIDCIRQTLLLAAARLPNRGDYAPVKDALLDAADKLDRIVEQNASASSGRVTPPIGGRPLAPTLPPLRAVSPEAQERAVAEAIAVLEEAETILLRSAENSERRLVHYQQVAQAIDSTKVLLRSS